MTPSEEWTLPEGAQVQCPRGVLAIRGKRHSKRDALITQTRASEGLGLWKVEPGTPGSTRRRAGGSRHTHKRVRGCG